MMKPFRYYDLNRWIETNNDLIRCPVCHTIPIIKKLPIYAHRHGYFVECPKCRINGNTEYTQEEAIKSWNKFASRRKKQ